MGGSGRTYASLAGNAPTGVILQTLNNISVLPLPPPDPLLPSPHTTPALCPLSFPSAFTIRTTTRATRYLTSCRRHRYTLLSTACINVVCATKPNLWTYIICSNILFRCLD